MNVVAPSINPRVRQARYPCSGYQAGAPPLSGSCWRRLCGCASAKERCWKECAFFQAASTPQVRVYYIICRFGLSITDTQGSFSAV